MWQKNRVFAQKCPKVCKITPFSHNFLQNMPKLHGLFHTFPDIHNYIPKILPVFWGFYKKTTNVRLPVPFFQTHLWTPKKPRKKGGPPDLGQNRPASIGKLIADPRAKTPSPIREFQPLFPKQYKTSKCGRKHRIFARKWPKTCKIPAFPHNFCQIWPKFCMFPTFSHKINQTIMKWAIFTYLSHIFPHVGICLMPCSNNRYLNTQNQSNSTQCCMLSSCLPFPCTHR